MHNNLNWKRQTDHDFIPANSALICIGYRLMEATYAANGSLKVLIFIHLSGNQISRILNTAFHSYDNPE